MNKLVLRRFISGMVCCTLMNFSSMATAQGGDKQVALDYRVRGYELQQEGRFEQALLSYERALSLDDTDSGLFNDLGLMAEQTGRIDEAEAYFLKGLSLDSGYLPLYFNIGLFYANQGKYSPSVKYLRERVSRGQPSDKWTLEAQAALEKIYNVYPYLSDRNVSEQVKFMEMDISLAKENFQKKMQKYQDLDYEMAMQNGLELLEQRQYFQAIEYFEVAVALDPRSANARYALKKAQFAFQKKGLEKDAFEMRQTQREQEVGDYLDYLSKVMPQT